MIAAKLAGIGIGGGTMLLTLVAQVVDKYPFIPSALLSLAGGIAAGGVSYGVMRTKIHYIEKKQSEQDDTFKSIDKKISDVHTEIGEVKTLIIQGYQMRAAGVLKTREDDQ